ncbi:MAG: hypothetical protein ACYC5M_03645 [Anaerolineae bacterium]
MSVIWGESHGAPEGFDGAQPTFHACDGLLPVATAQSLLGLTGLWSRLCDV